MKIANALVIFAMTWLVTFLMSLPIGVKIPEKPEPGHVASAPENPRVGKKALTTAVIASTITLICYFVLR